MERSPLATSSGPASRLQPSTQPQAQSPGSSNWEKKTNANGKVFYVNHKTKLSSWNLPGCPSSADLSFQTPAIPREGFASRTESDSEDVLQEFRLPRASAIKFEPDASPVHTSARNKQTHAAHKSGHQKHPSYDQIDREKVKAIFSSSSRPTSSSNTRPANSQPQNDAGRLRQSQRETKIPERLVTEPQLLKPVNRPSQTTTPRIEIQRKEQGQHRTQTLVPSQISVVIPASQHKSKPPIVNLEVDQSRKQSLLREMKKGVDIARERSKSVEIYFGTTGFSQIYGTNSDEERLKKIHKLQPRAKKVKRRDVKLDWGDDVLAAIKPFRPDKLMHPKEQVKEITKSKVSSLTGPPITIVNDIDDRGLNGKFQFVSQYVIREGVKRQQAHLHGYINCGSTCIGGCSPDTCACMQNDKMQIASGVPVPTYRQRRDGLIVLTEEFIKLSKTEDAKSEIVECNNNCHCDEKCFNRVVQKGRTLPLEIHMTKFCGFGLRSPQDIVRGQFIDVYLGELITEATLDKRENAQVDGEPSYIFTLDFFNEEDKANKANRVHYQVDGENFGSSMRFVNHSCNANCSVFPVMLKEYDKNIYGLAVFALKDIPAMTELTLDYAPQIEDDDIGDYAKCQCGEENCRGYLWPKPRAIRKRRIRKAI